MQFGNKKIKIGVLTPYSSIYPELIPSFVNGFYSVIPEKYQEEFEFIPEYVVQGGDKIVREAVQKLIRFHNVDIVSGMINYKSVPGIIPTIESNNKIGFFIDMGENIPFVQQLSNNVFFNSFQLWQSQYAIGYWSQQHFGDKGAVVMPVYDAGYHLHSAFRQGTISAGSKLIDYHVLPYTEGQSQVKGKLGGLFEKLEKNKPSFIHAIFCGNESSDFLNEYAGSKLNNVVPLIITAHMASEEMLSQISNLSISAYAASMWDFNRKEPVNQKFIQGFLNQTGQKANIFSLLGYEMGNALWSMFPELKSRNWDKIKTSLKTLRINSPRGERNFFLDSEYATPLIEIEKINLGGNQVHKLVIGQGRSLKYNNQIFTEIHKENVSGWENPYLCV